MATNARARGALVLIAEDDATVAALITEVVEFAGYAVLVAPNGSAALAIAREQWPALLITDLLMPGLDGTGLIAALHAEGCTCPPTILVTSAESDSWAFTGADVVLNKPFHIANLEALLARFLPL